MITDVQTYLKERIREVLAGTSHPIVIRIQGSDLEVLRSKAKELSAALQGIPGLTHPKVENQAELAQIQIQTDLAAAQRHGLKPGDIRRAASTLVNGEEVGDIFRDGQGLRHPGLEPAGGPGQHRRHPQPRSSTLRAGSSSAWRMSPPSS